MSVTVLKHCFFYARSGIILKNITACPVTEKKKPQVLCPEENLKVTTLFQIDAK